MCLSKLLKREKKNLVLMSSKEVRGILSSNLIDKMAKNPIVLLSDRNYTALSKAELQKIYKQSGLIRKKYKPEVFDCDDFAANMKTIVDDAARLTAGIIAPYAHGIVYGDIPTPHAINWFITPEKELLFLEPQTGRYFKPKGKNLIFLYT